MKKKIFTWISILGLLMIFTVAWCNYLVNKTSEPYLYQDTLTVPFNRVGLLLGTSRRLTDGRNNQYFDHRIQAAAELYRSGKVLAIVISGDNSTVYYNEPQDMKEELVKNGVPDSVIYLDYAGFRTFDSVIRSKAIFKQDKITIISQQFHNERAIFIARENGIEAIGYNAKDVSTYSGFKTNLRELFARVKLFLDLYILGEKPKFLGEPVEIAA